MVASQPKNEAKVNPLKSKNKSKKAVLAGGKNSTAAEESCLDPAEEKLRLKKLVEEGDLVRHPLGFTKCSERAVYAPLIRSGG